VGLAFSHECILGPIRMRVALDAAAQRLAWPEANGHLRAE